VSIPSTADNSPYQQGVTATTYNGRSAYRIDTATKQLNITANQDIPNPIDAAEDGVLIGFTIAVNDPLIRVTAILYGEQGSFTTLNDMTMKEVTYLGRGLTQGQAESVSPQHDSLDQKGVKDDIWPWIQRYRHTYALSHLNDLYSNVRGTEFDKWIVLAYTPQIKESYNRFYLTITNTAPTDQLIHVMQISRIKFSNQPSSIYGSGGGPSVSPARLDFGNTIM
jgi:hypothetical protein